MPVCNGGPKLAETVASIAAQADGRPMEIIVVEDGSQDGSAALLRSLAGACGLTVVDGPRRGAAAAVNAGIRLASHPIVCQVDQDVVLGGRLDAGARRRTRRSRRGRRAGLLRDRPGGVIFRTRDGAGPRTAVSRDAAPDPITCAQATPLTAPPRCATSDCSTSRSATGTTTT